MEDILFKILKLQRQIKDLEELRTSTDEPSSINITIEEVFRIRGVGIVDKRLAYEYHPAGAEFKPSRELLAEIRKHTSILETEIVSSKEFYKDLYSLKKELEDIEPEEL